MRMPNSLADQVTKRMTCTKTQRRNLLQGEDMSRKTLTRTKTSSLPRKEEGSWKMIPMRIQMSRLRGVEVGEASLPSHCMTTRPRLTTRSASTPTTSYPISKWSTKAGGSEKHTDASDSSRQTMSRYGNDVSGEGAEAEAGDGKRNEAELENIEKSLLSLFPRGDIFVFSWPWSLLLLKSYCFISTTHFSSCLPATVLNCPRNQYWVGSEKYSAIVF